MIGMDTFQKKKKQDHNQSGEWKIVFFSGMKAHEKDALHGHLSPLDRKLK